jgi:hypothetical protein
MSDQRVDFLQPPRPPRAGWALLAVGIASLAVALWCEHRWSIRRDAQSRADLAVSAARRAAQVPAARAEPTLVERRWTQAQQELRRPWLPALRAVESATASPVFLLSLAIDPSKGIVRLEAEAPSFDDALNYVQAVGQGDALQPATLVSHQQSADASGHGTVKFTLATRWIMP